MSPSRMAIRKPKQSGVTELTQMKTNSSPRFRQPIFCGKQSSKNSITMNNDLLVIMKEASSKKRKKDKSTKPKKVNRQEKEDDLMSHYIDKRCFSSLK